MVLGFKEGALGFKEGAWVELRKRLTGIGRVPSSMCYPVLFLNGSLEFVQTDPWVFHDWFCGDQHGAHAAVVSGTKGERLRSGAVATLSPWDLPSRWFGRTCRHTVNALFHSHWYVAHSLSL